MMRLYALVGRMRLVSARPVIDAAMRIENNSSRPTWGQTAPFMNCKTLPVRAG